MAVLNPSDVQVSAYRFAQLDTSLTTPASVGDVLTAARREADQIREQARAEGYAAGHATGIAEGREHAAPLLTALSDAVNAVTATRDELVERLTNQAGQVSLAIGEQVLSASLAVHPELVVDVTRSVLRRMSERHKLTVVVNPDDLEIVKDSIADLQGELGGVEQLDVQSDRRVGRGGCVVRTDYGEIDATIMTMFSKARELIESALRDDCNLPADEENGPADGAV